MHIVIAGVGRVGSELARRTSLVGHDVVAIDKEFAALDQLGAEFNGETILGEAFDIGVLREAGIEVADVFLAVTSSDNVNLMATEVVRRLFKTPRAIARLYDPARQPSYQALGVDYITGTQLIANVIYEQVISESFRFHVTFPEGDVEIIDFTLGSASPNSRSGTSSAWRPSIGMARRSSRVVDSFWPRVTSSSQRRAMGSRVASNTSWRRHGEAHRHGVREGGRPDRT